MIGRRGEADALWCREEQFSWQMGMGTHHDPVPVRVVLGGQGLVAEGGRQVQRVCREFLGRQAGPLRGDGSRAQARMDAEVLAVVVVPGERRQETGMGLGEGTREAGQVVGAVGAWGLAAGVPVVVGPAVEPGGVGTVARPAQGAQKGQVVIAEDGEEAVRALGLQGDQPVQQGRDLRAVVHVVAQVHDSRHGVAVVDPVEQPLEQVQVPVQVGDDDQR